MLQRKIGRPGKDDALDRKKLVLNAAIEIISEVGFEKLKLTEVGKRANVAPALIRHYFGSKEGLVSACTHSVKRHLEIHLTELFSQMAKIPNGQLFQALCDFYQGQNKDHRVMLGYMCWLFLSGGDDADEIFSIYHKALESLMTTFKQRGIIKDEVGVHWFAQQCISLQLGPYFLNKPLRNQLGCDPFDEEINAERSSAMLRTLTAAALFELPTK